MKNTNRRSEEEIKKWYEEHVNSKISLIDLNKKYKTDCGYHFKKLNLKPIDVKIYNRKGYYKIKNYIEEIKTEFDAYILGLWFADGHITKNQAAITMHERDENILLKIIEYISPDQKLIKNRNNCKRLLISSKMFVENLKKHGIKYNKTNNEYSIPKMPRNLVRHFIRGYFDGDGSLYYDKKYLRFNICSINKLILNEIFEIFRDNEIDSSINEENRSNIKYNIEGRTFIGSKNMFRIFVRKKDSLLKLYDFLYKDSNIYLDRKFNLFKKYVNTEVIELNKNISTP